MRKRAPHYFKTNLLILSLFIALFSSTSTATETNNFNVHNVLHSFQGSRLIVFSQLDLTLSKELIEAINNGVAISISVEYAKPRQTFFGSTYDVITSATYEIERHSLSNRYLMRDIKTDTQNIFNSIQAALDNLGRSLKQSIDFNDDFKQLAIRCYVDKFRLPGPLRFKAFFSNAWSPNSGWSLWPLKAQ